ncbi:hypothetical protein HYPSUDRAFT_433040 [Hypholoma sublateritium FD-334 SS-4]|uniref:Uncharacterized protein n=1 Tax=Hypholoma sublateritium (strain FD-334 SS-4) TaxID=945553 RepID=A0A0D2ND49_HYPSF|nr:hypothetical protein HYPSUDRAFT_433040 [Hypholoma sublateritium FD-334 SS-4]
MTNFLYTRLFALKPQLTHNNHSSLCTHPPTSASAMLHPHFTPAAAVSTNPCSHLNALIFIIFPFTYFPLPAAVRRRRRLRLPATHYPRTHRLSERVVCTISSYSIVAFMQLLVYHPDAFDALCRLVINCGVCIDTFETLGNVSRVWQVGRRRKTIPAALVALRKKEAVGLLAKHFLCHQYWFAGEFFSAEELLLTIQLPSREYE